MRRATVRPTGRPAYHTGFLSTLSLRRATRVARTPTMEVTISIHALLAESDSPSTFFYIILQNFYPRSPCGERPASSLPFRAVWIISIHALLAESDIFNTCRAKPIHAFLSTLSLRRATVILRKRNTPSQFLSTLSLRRATPELDTLANKTPFISIHALLAESDLILPLSVLLCCISIHALLAESDF